MADITLLESNRYLFNVGNTFRTIALFENFNNTNGSWTIEFYVEKEFENNTYEVKMKFLVESAPHEYLRLDNKFSVMDGKRIIANGLIVKCCEE